MAGHSALLGRINRPWQATQSVLMLFGPGNHAARAAYHRFLADGVGRDPALERAAGALRRHPGGWLQPSEHIRGREQWAFDERVLGSAEFFGACAG